MSTHISENLPRLLTGEANRDEVLDAAAHLRSCADCQQELVSAVVAHASLTSAGRFAHDVMVPRPPETGAQPERTPANADEQASTARAVPALPDASELFSRVRAEAEQPERTGHRSRRLLAGVAAAVVLAGGGVAAGVLASGSSGPPTRAVALTGPGDARATVTLIGTDHMRINAASLPTLGPDQQYEVWLTDARGRSMQAVGFLRSDRAADISVPSPLMLSYKDIAVSVQRVRQTAFSGDVVLHGSYL